MPRFLKDECTRTGCEEPVVKLVADKVRTAGSEEERTEVVGFCREHKRDRQVRYDHNPGPGDYGPEDPMPF